MKLTCRQIRDVVKARGLLLDDSHDDGDSSVVALTHQIEDYVAGVGLPTYVSQMLGDAEKCSIKMCSLYWPDGRVFHGSVEVAATNRGCRVLVWILENCRPDNVPYKVEAHLGVDLTAVRYL
jgi:hypothetical protein